MSKPKEFSSMTKDKLMTYTFVALLVLTGVAVLSFGTDIIVVAAVAVLVALGADSLIGKVASDSKLNTMSAAVFGLIVALCYSLGLPTMGLGIAAGDIYPQNPTMQGLGLFVYPALISMIGMVVFKKLPSRKLVNPAAAAKLIVLVLMLSVALFPAEHTDMMPSLTSSLSYNTMATGQIMPFGLALQQCYGKDFTAYSSFETYAYKTVEPNDVLYTLGVMKYHGWPGGVSTIAVLLVGIVLFALCRRYIKWRITVAYLVTAAVLAGVLGLVYADADPLLRIAFHLCVGSSIFMAFFMATDPATTPLTFSGQVIFGAGLAILTILMQTYLNFLGASIFALVIMNLTVPILDKVGKLKPSTEKKEPKLPKAKSYAPEKVKEYNCMRCGACMRVCCHKLSPILIKQAFDKMDVDTLNKLNADYCTGCGHCTFVCPSRIDLRKSVLQAKGMLRQEAS